MLPCGAECSGVTPVKPEIKTDMNDRKEGAQKDQIVINNHRPDRL
jgi:hypothetical protein